MKIVETIKQPEYSAWNVVALFDEELTDELVNLSRYIAVNIPSKIVLNKVDTLPHMTIYTTNYPTRNLVKIENALNNVVQKFHSFSVQFSNAVIDMNTVFINADLNQKLQYLHINVVDSLNPLRDEFYDEKELDLIGDNKARKKSLLTYGMWAAKELYVPHISVSRPFDVSKCKSALDLLPEKIYYLTKINHIALVERGHDGTCKKILKIYSLKE